MILRMSNYPWPLLEFQHLFPFNRRFWPVAALDNVLKIAAGVKALTYRDFSTATATLCKNRRKR